MKGKTVVITGGTSGIGEIAAERLAQMGARIVLIARSKSRGEVTLARLHEKTPDLAHAVHYADLARISEMKRVAAEVASQEPRIDVLINNAGAMFSSRRLTEDGLALNHMAYFVITEGLRERLLASSRRCHVVESLMRVRRVSQLKSCGGDDFAPRLHG
jgi:short-subunit dehydrogenase